MKNTCVLLAFTAFVTCSLNPQVQASRSYDVYDSVGINTHWYFGSPYQYQSQFPTLLNSMTAAHLRHFRDGVYAQGTNTPSSLTQMYSTLAANDIHGELIVPQSTTISAATLEAGLLLYPGIEAIEPPNEWDINGGSAWASTLLAEEPAILAAGHALGLTVLGPALTQPASYSQLGNITQFLDDNNIHAYFGGRNPETGGWGGPDAEGNYYGSLAWNLDLLQNDAPNVPGWATETGYITTGTPTQNEIPESVAGTYAPRLVFEFFKHGLKRTYFYELVDDPAGIAEPGYGLLRTDLSATPAYTALSNLLGILKDDAVQFTPESLTYALTGNMTGVETILIEKNAGDFYLAVWLNGSIYDVNALVATPVAPQALTFSLPATSIVSLVYSFNSNGTVTTASPNRSTYTMNANSCVTLLHITSASPVATPVFSVPAGVYTSPQSVAISDSTPGAQIYYTTNGSVATTGSTLYTGPIYVGGSQTLSVVASAPGYSNSAVVSAAYTVNLPTAAPPAFSVASGTYASSRSLVLSDSTPGAQIFYTTDGSIPTASSTRYTGAITVASTQTVNAIAVASGYYNSAVVSATYTISGTVSSSLINATGSYRLINQASGLCIDDGGNLNSGAPLTQWQCWPGNFNQAWWFAASSPGYYSIGDINTSTSVWTVPGGSSSSNTPLQQASASHAMYQQWAPLLLSTGYYEFIDANSGMCLTVPNGANTNGLQLQISSCNAGPSQSFVLGSISTTITAGAWYQAINARSGMCVTNPASTVTNGAPLTQANCGSLLNQEWRFQSVNGYQAVYSGNASPLVWDDTNWSTANGSPMQLWAWSNNSNEEWTPKLQSNWLWTFAVLTSGDCLDNAGSLSSGTRMTQWSCTTGNSNQQFELVRVR
jgi:hypothetical protein